MTAYYNEFDPKVANWVRQLIKNGEIAPGEVDERSIIDVTAQDLKGFTQHHFFAGVATWSLALRNAGWPDDKPVCTASLPCQPFSVAGHQKGKEDERHLLPHFIELVKQCGFNTIFGEQVPAAIKHGWLDDLHHEMERENYTVGATVLTAAGAGKAHPRQRLYWVANATKTGSQRRLSRGEDSERENFNRHIGCDSADIRMADTLSKRQKRECREGQEGAAEYGANSRVVNPKHNGLIATEKPSINAKTIHNGKKGQDSPIELKGASSPIAISEESIDWLYCADGKYRPIKSGIKPLVNGLARGVVHSSDSVITPNDSAEAKTLRIKAYGNAIVLDTAELFIKAFMSIDNQQQ